MRTGRVFEFALSGYLNGGSGLSAAPFRDPAELVFYLAICRIIVNTMYCIIYYLQLTNSLMYPMPRVREHWHRYRNTKHQPHHPRKAVFSD